MTTVPSLIVSPRRGPERGSRPRRGGHSSRSRLALALCLALAGVDPALAAPADAKSAPGADEASPETAGPGGGSGPSTPPAQPPSPLNPKPPELPPRPTGAQAAARLDALLSRVADLRSRVAALTSSLFSSRLRVEVQTRGDAVGIKSLSVTLDGGIVYTAPAQRFFDEPEAVYEHAVAPGPHVLGIEIERYDRKNQQFSTWQASRFVVVVPEKKLLWTRLELEDDSSMAEDFPEDREGSYELGVKLQAEVAD